MSRTTLSALVLLTFALSCTAVFAQDPEETTKIEPSTSESKSFKLLRSDTSAASDLDLAEEQAEAWIPGLQPGKVELSLGVGFLNLNTTLLQHDQIIYKYTTEATFWGDVEIKGESAFAPTLRLGYGLTRWFALEGWAGVSFSKYKATVTNSHSRKNEPGAPIVDNPPLAEFDEENRSLITLQAGINAVIYPFAIGGDGDGIWHPYVTAGAGGMSYDMNSNYTAGPASSVDVNAGAGIRLLVDDAVSLRFEVMYHHNTLEWTPADYFLELNEGTTRVPLNEYFYDENGALQERPVTEFASHTLGLLQWSIGVQGSF
ncbi:MAG: hypothetical protein DRQ54_11200 [Gammaproteobacteria bacterium]|nr:MAG: hypothetical protein DRQ54_11200 [Gammaproteobacteria bacterium]